MDHTHSHNHNAPKNYNKAFAIGVLLNGSYIVVEVVYGILTNSMALLADAGHNLSDVLGLLLAWGASYFVLKQPTKLRTYGFKKSSILAALFNAILLFVAVGAIGYESISRFIKPEPVEGGTIIFVAAVGVAINLSTALLFMRGKEFDLNIKGAFLHMAADAAVSLGVVAGGIIILYTNQYWVDPVLSIIIMVVILIGTWNLLKDSFNLALDSVPAAIDIHKVEAYLLSLSGVKEVHDLHIWAMSTTETALTAHLIKEDLVIDDTFTNKICDELHHRFDIHHSTIQFESGELDLTCKINCSK